MRKFCKVCWGKHFALGLCRKHYYSKPEVKAKARAYKQKPEVKAKARAKQKAKWRMSHYPKPTINEIIDKKIAERAEHLKKRGIYCRGILPRKYLTNSKGVED